ncbi:hypothetical protein KJ853_02375 [Patescibacteria group bacterium]|nr:hypothetical protein [Patescibacteria group bacterium]
MIQENKPYIDLGGERIPVEYKKLDIFELKFYPENPRILSIVMQKPKMKTSDELIDKELFERNETRKLSRSIEKHGGLIHPVIVYNNFVLEGNTRLCCFRHLYNESKEEKWRFINCQIILAKELNKEKIDSLLGSEHIIGKIEWGTFEKGCWMEKMLDEDGYSIETVKEIVNHSEKWIQDHVWAYKTMVEEKIKDKDKFSHFVQVKANAEIWKIKRNKDTEIISKVIKYIKNGQVPTAQDVRKIPKLWLDRKSKRKLEEGEKVDQAYYEQKARDITLTSTFLRDAEELTKKMRDLTIEKRDEIKKDGQAKFIIGKLTKECTKLSKELGV